MKMKISKSIKWKRVSRVRQNYEGFGANGSKFEIKPYGRGLALYLNDEFKDRGETVTFLKAVAHGHHLQIARETK